MIYLRPIAIKAAAESETVRGQAFKRLIWKCGHRIERDDGIDDDGGHDGLGSDH
jgi:hypothetical protein